MLSAGPTPHTPLENWTFSIKQGGQTAKSWSWQEIRDLPAQDVTADIHCVTKWSKLDTRWQAVSLDTLLAQVEHEARYVLAFCDGGYTTNLPLADVTGGQAWLAYGYDGSPLQPEHGGPARLLVPHLYFWKSAKWVRGLELLDRRRARILGALRLPQLRRSMAGTAVRGRLTWQVATVASLRPETASVRTIELDMPDWAGHQAGQHVDIRLTADDGYVAERSYSIASAPGEPLQLTVERLEDGEVSPYLTEELRAGDEIEIRGPIGGYFVWDGDDAAPPVLLVAGGSGVVPFRSMLRHRRRDRQQRAGPAAVLGPVTAGRDLPHRAGHAERRRGGRLHADPAAAAWLDRAFRPGDRGAAGREVAWPAAGIRWRSYAGRQRSSRP